MEDTPKPYTDAQLIQAAFYAVTNGHFFNTPLEEAAALWLDEKVEALGLEWNEKRGMWVRKAAKK